MSDWTLKLGNADWTDWWSIFDSAMVPVSHDCDNEVLGLTAAIDCILLSYSSVPELMALFISMMLEVLLSWKRRDF